MNAGKTPLSLARFVWIFSLALVLLPTTATFAATTTYTGGECTYTKAGATSSADTQTQCVPNSSACTTFCSNIENASCGVNTTCSSGANCGYTDHTCNVGQRSGSAAPSAPPVRKLENPLSGVKSIQDLVGKAITIFTGISGSVALLMFVYGGVLLLTSGGSEQQVSKGKKAMVWATVGLVLIFTAYAILHLLFTSIGLSA